MRFRARIGTIMVGIAAIALGLAGFLEWRRGGPPAPPMGVRIARAVLAERSARSSSRPSRFNSVSLASFAVAALVASKMVRAISTHRRNR
ncbi:hypothetical protein P12x_002839 [Tundrisphaera lichenicola]|uniref:hypothetical protein n=1 Tax=Tundrisphaera lichenicola TaxID=2029860 RepID=UPI003EC05EE0